MLQQAHPIREWDGNGWGWRGAGGSEIHEWEQGAAAAATTFAPFPILVGSLIPCSAHQLGHVNDCS